ncbi:MAG: glycerol-3-phosphate 1-O-acyltransferase [Candidatus Pelagibacter sp. TMED263]|jgi:glycerol-3-phosphate acyltransferase PlsY|nr:MAG: glycerol-3-phosphate 1-O-acyltransferase [Candidatus Pelagibacter sp. TMED263]
MEYFIIGFCSYLMGSIPFGFLLSKLILKKDIRNIGSGNIGATNVLRTGNKFIAYSTLILDIGKAVIPVIFIKINYPDYVFVVSLCVFLGHVFPLWLKFKGGKGVATYLGILFSLNIIYGLIFVIIWFVTFIISKYSSLSSLIASLSIPIYLISFKNDNYIFFLIMFILIFYTHRENIKRLKNKEETKTKIY